MTFVVFPLAKVTANAEQTTSSVVLLDSDIKLVCRDIWRCAHYNYPAGLPQGCGHRLQTSFENLSGLQKDMNTRLIVALDFSEAEKALAFAQRLQPDLCRLKIGSELFVACGPQFVQTLMDRGFEIFLDLKFHDIPNTVAAAVTAVSRLGVWMVNIHASGGRAMMQAAKHAIAVMETPPRLIAVTMLTSLDDTDLKEVGISAAVFDQAQKLATLAKSAGLDGVVCSGHEATALRQALGDEFLLVTPGIRLAGDNTDDQKRIMTPVQAMVAGADYLVIGRSITRAQNPVATIQAINAQIEPIVSGN